MGVLRLGYVHVRVTDLEEAKNHYVNTLGLEAVQTEGNRLYLKGWDEWEHHSVVLEEGGVGLVKLGIKVETDDDLNNVENNARSFGATVQRMSAGESLEVGQGLRITTPGDHVVEVYNQMTFNPSKLGYHTPEAFPRHLNDSVGVPALDHMLLACEDATLSEKFFKDVFDLYPTEQVKPEVDSDVVLATWLSASQKAHDIAILGGLPNGKLHHFAFQLDDWSSILYAADIFSMDEVSIDIGPTRHGITRGKTIYFFDPSGNRNETFAGGSSASRDKPLIVWTPDQLGKGIFYHDRVLNERFTTVVT